MKTQSLGRSSLSSSRLSYGAMRVVGTSDPKSVTPEHEAKAKKAFAAALDAGYTLFDHADIYCRGMCEKAFGDFLRENPAVRDEVLIATKCGIRFGGDPEPDSPHRYDFSAEHILFSCEQSLKRLNTDRIDLYQLHRPDWLMNPPEIAEAFDKLKQQGKVREFGVSNFIPSYVSLLQSACDMPLIVNQVQISLEDLTCFYDGTIDQCHMQTITPLAWSPVARGFLAEGGKVPENHPRRDVMLKLVEQLDQTAADYGVSRTAISLAWLMKHPSKIIPIVGSANPDHITDAARADEIDLSREDWYRLLIAARGERLP